MKPPQVPIVPFLWLGFQPQMPVLYVTPWHWVSHIEPSKLGLFSRLFSSGRWWKVDLQGEHLREGENPAVPRDVLDLVPQNEAGMLRILLRDVEWENIRKVMKHCFLKVQPRTKHISYSSYSNLGKLSPWIQDESASGSKIQQGRKAEHLVPISLPQILAITAIIPELSQFMSSDSSVTGPLRHISWYGVVILAVIQHAFALATSKHGTGFTSVFKVLGPFSVRGCAPDWWCLLLYVAHVNVHLYLLNRDWNILELCRNQLRKHPNPLPMKRVGESLCSFLTTLCYGKGSLEFDLLSPSWILVIKIDSP